MTRTPGFSRAIAAVVFIAAASCTDATSPVTKYAALSTAQQVFLGLPGEQLQSLPAVTVYDYRTGEGIANVSVRFTSAAGPGLDYTTTSGTDGVARLNSLKLSSTPLKYSVKATVEGVGSVTFTTIAVSSTLLQKYEIVSSGGVAIPENSDRRVLELFDDGTYAWGNDRNGSVTLGPRARYATGEFDVTLCRDPKVAGHTSTVNDCGFVLANGTLIGDKLHVNYMFDPILDYDFDIQDEVYVRQN